MLQSIISETREEVMKHPECLSLTTVVTAKGNHYHFINTDAVFSGDYQEQEGHIQTLISADDTAVCYVCTMFYPQVPGHIPQPDMAVGYIFQRLVALHPDNGEAIVPGWGGINDRGEDIYTVKPLRVVAPPAKV